MIWRCSNDVWHFTCLVINEKIAGLELLTKQEKGGCFHKLENSSCLVEFREIFPAKYDLKFLFMQPSNLK